MTCMFISCVILYIQYKRGLWKPAMIDLDIRDEGHVLTDEDFPILWLSLFVPAKKVEVQQKLSAKTATMHC